MLYFFAKAYQSENLRSSQQNQVEKKRSAGLSTAGAAFLDHLGNLLIKLGSHLKQHSPCPELTHGPA